MWFCRYNGTIFAYGQTSSGKTYTIEGSSKRYSDRGLIPRVITAVFEEVERRCGLGQDVSVHVSYMEIYQDTGYDLLNPGMRPGALMVTLPKVSGPRYSNYTDLAVQLLLTLRFNYR